MKFLCTIKQEGVSILRCFAYDGRVEIPEKIHGMEVRELGPYVFADIVRRREAGGYYLAQMKEEGVVDGLWEWEECPESLLDAEALEDGTPVVKGQDLCSISLPAGVKKIGAYAFYLCEKLERMEFYSTVFDLGAGLFTGCLGIEELDIRMAEGEKSCFKEVLAELRQTLRVNICDKEGKVEARLVFPEYYEESIENTPARILTLEVHGCGHRYRNAFSGTQLQYPVYDKLFAHVQVQESADLVTELALGRLRFPLQLGEERRKVYEEYLEAHGREIVNLAFRYPEEMTEILEFAGKAEWCTKRCMEEMLDEAGQREHPIAMGVLMELGRRQRLRMAGEGCRSEEGQEIHRQSKDGGRRRRFVL